MNVLIAFAGKHGCTQKCAELIAKKLSGNIDIMDFKKSKDADLDKYEKVIIGSSLYYTKIQKEAAEFCSKHLDSLNEKKLGLFVCGMQKDTAETAITQNFPVELLRKSQFSRFIKSFSINYSILI